MSYLIIANIYLTLFYLFYRFFLSKETFFQLNRVYLIGTSGLSFIIPLVQSDWLQQTFGTETVYAARSSLEAVTIHAQPTTVDAVGAASSTISWWVYIYVIGCCCQLGIGGYRYFLIMKKLRHKQKGDAYSFMRHIRVDDEQLGGQKIREHEVVHARQLHTVDLLLIEGIKIFNWFNPVVYYLSKSLRLIHEYIADATINRSQADKIAYAELLMAATFQVSPLSLANNFFNRPQVKNRITMLFRNQSSRRALFKYVLAMPLFIAMLVFSSAKVGDKAVAVTTQAIFPEQDFEAFYNLVGRNTHYLTEAKKNQVQGVVDVAFEHSGEEIKSLKTLYTMGYKEEEEVERVLRSPEVKRVMPQGKYVLRVKFILQNVTPKRLDPPIVSPADHTVLKVITIVAYSGTDQTAHSTDSAPPPPPKDVRASKAVQDTSQEVTDFNKVEIQPTFPGGLAAFYRWVGKNYSYPSEATKKGVSGSIHVSFIVEIDGSLSHIELTKDLGYGTGEAAINMLKRCPKWKPGLVDGRPVRTQYSLPIKLNLQGFNSKQDTVKTRLDLRVHINASGFNSKQDTVKTQG